MKWLFFWRFFDGDIGSSGCGNGILLFVDAHYVLINFTVISSYVAQHWLFLGVLEMALDVETWVKL